MCSGLASRAVAGTLLSTIVTSCNIGSKGSIVETASGVLIIAESSTSLPARGVQVVPIDPAPGLSHGDGCVGLQCPLGHLVLGVLSANLLACFLPTGETMDETVERMLSGVWTGVSLGSKTGARHDVSSRHGYAKGSAPSHIPCLMASGEAGKGYASTE
jgi:hypothetical protein